MLDIAWLHLWLSAQIEESSLQLQLPVAPPWLSTLKVELTQLTQLVQLIFKSRRAWKDIFRLITLTRTNWLSAVLASILLWLRHASGKATKMLVSSVNMTNPIGNRVASHVLSSHRHRLDITIFVCENHSRAQVPPSIWGTFNFHPGTIHQCCELRRHPCSLSPQPFTDSELAIPVGQTLFGSEVRLRASSQSASREIGKGPRG